MSINNDNITLINNSYRIYIRGSSVVYRLAVARSLTFHTLVFDVISFGPNHVPRVYYASGVLLLAQYPTILCEHYNLNVVVCNITLFVVVRWEPEKRKTSQNVGIPVKVPLRSVPASETRHTTLQSGSSLWPPCRTCPSSRYTPRNWWKCCTNATVAAPKSTCPCRAAGSKSAPG